MVAIGNRADTQRGGRRPEVVSAGSHRANHEGAQDPQAQPAHSRGIPISPPPHTHHPRGSVPSPYPSDPHSIITCSSKR